MPCAASGPTSSRSSSASLPPTGQKAAGISTSVSSCRASPASGAWISWTAPPEEMCRAYGSPPGPAIRSPSPSGSSARLACWPVPWASSPKPSRPTKSSSANRPTSSSSRASCSAIRTSHCGRRASSAWTSHGRSSTSGQSCEWRLRPSHPQSPAFNIHVSPLTSRLRMSADDSVPISRRTFVKNTATTAAALAVGPMIVPRHVLGMGFQAPSDTLNVAMIGIGGMGKENMTSLINAGVIGPIREVHVWTDRPQRYWAQGIPRPALPGATPAPTPAPAPSPFPPAPPSWNMRAVDRAVLAAMAANPQEIPPGLQWDLFIGPAKFYPYHPAYHPFSWRGWVDFGVSAIGDMGAHLIDQRFWALGLGLPTAITSTSTAWGGPANNPGTYPLAMSTRYEFAARGDQPPVVLTWYDGGLVPMISGDFVLPRGDGGGGEFVGENGFITYETHGNRPKGYPETAAARAEQGPMCCLRTHI